jgi:hypothetical protein
VPGLLFDSIQQLPKEQDETMRIKCNAFVKRQTAESPFSFLADPIGQTADWRTLEVHVEECLEEPAKLDAIAKEGYKPGVVVLSIPPSFAGFRFYSGVTMLTETTPLRARFAARRPGEAAFVEVQAIGPKTEAVAVDIILYSRALLVEEGETPEADTDYEIVSINARTSAEPEPMSPMAMARNFLALPGGTKAEYTAQQFAEAILYWSTRTMHGGNA